MPAVVWRDLGRVEYGEALALQREIALARREDPDAEDVILLLEHPPVLTYGRAASRAHIVEEPARLAERLVSVVEIERGGDVTYHGPGQLVGYPIIDLEGFRKDLHWYLRSLEEVLIRTLGGLGLAAARADGLTGVWVGAGLESMIDAGQPEGDGRVVSITRDRAAAAMRTGEIRKIASIGIHASRWVTMHGFALNRTDEALEGFRWIVPCGLDGVTVTSIQSEGIDVSADELARRVIGAFADVLGVVIRPDDRVSTRPESRDDRVSRSAG
ncbi:MAG: lipoyl(octanoyl) transferase LipB [Gemmatimonadota bacterium]|nr:lipoyl(octanoyl) transferase LipB [Gemmatimonadota bacterium]